MSWNPVDWAKSGANWASDKLGDVFGDPGAAGEADRKKLLYEQAAAAGGFAGVGEAGYGAMTAEANAARQNLADQASGKLSYSREALRQGLQQNVGAQQSLAAGASPQNAAMSARTAAMQSARLGSGMSGQAALAGIQEQSAAAKALQDAILAQRGQDMQVGLGSRQNAMSGYGAGNAGQPEKSWIERNGQAISGAAALASDRNLKTDIADGDAKAKSAMEGLKAYSYNYKDGKYGKGEQLGVMAQDLQKAGLGQAVLKERDGLKVDPGKLAGALAAMVATQHRRISKLEGGKK
ncbi:MAG: tail fiber domain-containing protein [Deltaproteobacteria bacterium]|nr:tail fiber domain-containing protein [Deltaproteobacteria bacterium]